MPSPREQRQPVLMAEPKKQVPLRLNAKLYDALAAWAEDDFRSVNGQIEYLLTECVKYRKRTQKTNSNSEPGGAPNDRNGIGRLLRKGFARFAVGNYDCSVCHNHFFYF